MSSWAEYFWWVDTIGDGSKHLRPQELPHHFSYFYELARCCVLRPKTNLIHVQIINDYSLEECVSFIWMELGVLIYTEMGRCGTATKPLRYSIR